jgi:NAD(P)-dependent dehydrogenase (short-subunit alcohol dehydrogenase family)
MSKCILIIGGAGGVGSAVVGILASRGYTVATTVLDAAEADSIHARYDGAVKAHTVDLSNATVALKKIKLLVGSARIGRSVCLRRKLTSRSDGADFPFNLRQGI